MEGYTARDALIVMRLDLTDTLHQIQEELSDVEETLEFAGIAEQLLHDDPMAAEYPAIRRWLETVSNRTTLECDRAELRHEQEELLQALHHLEERLNGAD